jgi:hypothetical protein
MRNLRTEDEPEYDPENLCLECGACDNDPCGDDCPLFVLWPDEVETWVPDDAT